MYCLGFFHYSMYRHDQNICWNKILPFVITIFWKATALFCECLRSHIFWAICCSRLFILKFFRFFNSAEEQQLAQRVCCMVHIPVKRRQFYLAFKCAKKEKKVSFPGWGPSCLKISGFYHYSDKHTLIHWSSRQTYPMWMTVPHLDSD